MHRNTARIESLEYTKAAIIKQRVDAAYREAATEKVELEIDVLKDGDKDNAIVVHNSLPIPEDKSWPTFTYPRYTTGS